MHMTGRKHLERRVLLSIAGLILVCTHLQGQWIQTPGPGGGTVDCILPDGSNLFSGTVWGGVYLSTNMGMNWNPARGGLTNNNVRALASGGGNLFAGTAGGVFRSTNNGTTWISLNTSFTDVSSLAFSGAVLLAGVYGDGAYVSTDNGVNWHQTLVSQSVSCLTVSGSNIYAGTRGAGMFYSTDNGGTWENRRNGLTPEGMAVSGFAISGVNLFAATAGGVFLSTDAGMNWTQAGGGSLSVSVQAVAVNGPNLFAGTLAAGVYRSTDNGSNWTPASAGLVDIKISSLAVSGSVLFAGTEAAGVFSSADNGNTWAVASQGIPQALTTALARNGTTMYAGTGGAGFFLSSDNGGSWLMMNYGLGNPNIWSFAINGADVYAGTSAGVFRSTNNGAVWTPANAGITSTIVTSLATNGGYLFAGFPGGVAGGVFRSSDNGATWSLVKNGLPSSVNVFALLARGTKLFAGTDSGAYVSSDNGAQWTGIKTGLGGSAIYALADSGTTIYAGGTGKVFLTTTDGAVWTDLSSGFPGNTVASIAVVGSNVFVAFAGGGGGIYCSTRKGEGWTPVNEGLWYLENTSLAVNGTDLFTGTLHTSVWRRPLYEMAVPSNPVARPASGMGVTGFTANWNPVAGASGYRLDVSTDSVFGSFVAGYNNTNTGSVTAYQVTGLSPATAYWYRVRAFNAVGSSDNSNTITLVTLQAPPGRPTARAASNVSNTGFTANWSAVTGALSYHLDVATDLTFLSYVPGYNHLDVGPDTNHAVTGLTPATDYYYQVRAVNGGGEGAASNVTLVTTAANAPAAPTANSPTNVTTSGFTANWSSVSGATAYLLDVALDAGFTSFQSGFNNLDVGYTTSYAVSGVPEATVYYYRVRAKNNGVAGPSSNSVNVTTLRSYPQLYTVQTTVPFNNTHKALSEYDSTDYQLVGIPGNPGASIAGIVGGVQGTDWEIYWDNGTSVAYPGYYVRFSSGDPHFNCTAGKAFWLLHLGSWVLTGRTVATAVLDTSGNATVPLTPGAGFNLITNPFLYSVPWSRLTNANGITDSLRAWTSSGWVRASSFDPYRGYLFFNGGAKTALRIPLDATLPKRGAEKPADAASWRVDVVVRSGRFADQTTSFGVTPDALPGLDSYEQRKPRHMGGVPDAYFSHREWDANFPDFATDIRDRVGDLSIWDLSVRSDGKRPVAIEFQGIDRIPADLSVRMIDESAAFVQDLRASAVYALSPHVQVTPVRVAVGKPEYVRALAAKVVPSRFALLQNYPNPFNPRTTIPVDIPEGSSIELGVYDVLGRPVASVYNGPVSAGRHFFEWDGRSDAGVPVASGLYFTRLTVRNGITIVSKMTMVR